MNLAVVCLIAFLTVMLLLSVLATVIRLLTRIFAEVTDEASVVDAATVAAIQSAVAHQYPGACLLRIETGDGSS